jgi:NAD(P)-dependent dehydrogenase (short-subunit alcohol dehydrogenase family)
MTTVAGRTAFITGGANGIGLGIARAFAGAGAKVALADLDETALDTARTELSKVTEVETVVLDVRDREAYARAADQVEAALGPVSLLFNNAGVAGGAAPAKMSYALWDWGVGINLGGVINGVQTFLPRMAKRGEGGHIVNTASGAGLVALGSGVLYHTTKFAVVGMSEALWSELKPTGIGVSVLCPGPVDTNIMENTRKTQPESGRTLTPEQRAQADERAARTKRFLERGVSPDAVGHMVLNAVQGDQLYIYADHIMLEPIQMRTKALLDAIPPA